MTGTHGTLAERGEYWSRKREGMSCQIAQEGTYVEKKDPVD
jgi:hypothetical protein